MDIRKTVEDLRLSLTSDPGGAYRLPCRKALLKVMLQGTSRPVVFTARDKVRFRISDDGLAIELQETGAVCKRFIWKQVESVVAGEPETDSGLSCSRASKTPTGSLPPS
jgi:hypothetical protein